MRFSISTVDHGCFLSWRSMLRTLRTFVHNSLLHKLVARKRVDIVSC